MANPVTFVRVCQRITSSCLSQTKTQHALVVALSGLLPPSSSDDCFGQTLTSRGCSGSKPQLPYRHDGLQGSCSSVTSQLCRSWGHIQASTPQCVILPQCRAYSSSADTPAYTNSSSGIRTPMNSSSTSSSRDCIHIRGARFYGYHGVLPEEKVVGQPFVVDLSLELGLSRAGQTDDLNHTVSYADVFDDVRKIVEGTRCALLEAVAEGIAGQLLSKYTAQGVTGIRVSISKTHIPKLSAAVQSVGVEIYRTQQDVQG